MKTSFLFCLLVAFICVLEAQIVNIPDVNFKAELIAIGLDTNGDGEIQNIEAESVTNLNISNANISSVVGIQMFSNLTYFSCFNNQLTYLDVGTLTNLTYLACYNNQLTYLDVSNLTNLTQLHCANNYLTSLNLSNLPHFQSLNCADNQITTLFLKNGSFESSAYFHNNPLQYICVDSVQLYWMQLQAAQTLITHPVINSFCSFAPSGNYNTISGKSIYDENLNGCGLSDSTLPYLVIYVTNGIDTGYVCSNANGYYETYLDAGTFTLTPQLQNPAYFSISPISTNIYFSNNNNNLQTQDFCIIPNSLFPDVEIVLSPITPARPGFNAAYRLFFHNKGTTTVSGDINLDFMGNKMTFVSANVPPVSQNANQITWNYTNLQPFESRIITFTMNILPPPTNNMGDMLNFVSSIPLANDEYDDNYFPFVQNIVDSYDPNDKTCLEGNQVSNTEIGEYLHYLIRFQNTGTLYAEKVVVIDSIDASKFDILSFQIMEMSHLGQVRITGNVVEFYFDQIMLPDSFTNEPLSHGYILFKIKTKSSLPFNSVVKNKAEIYFDYNLPVVTNTAITTFSNATGIAAEIQAVPLKCYPNPAENTLTIETTNV